MSLLDAYLRNFSVISSIWPSKSWFLQVLKFYEIKSVIFFSAFMTRMPRLSMDQAWFFFGKKHGGDQTYLKTPLSGPLETRCFCVFRAKTKFPRPGWYSPGALETCFFRAISFIHRKASQNGRRGEFLGISWSSEYLNQKISN